MFSVVEYNLSREHVLKLKPWSLNRQIYVLQVLLHNKRTLILENLVPRVNIHQALVSQFSYLAEFFIEKLPIED